MLQTRTPQAFSSTPLHSLARAQFVVMLRRVLVVAGLAQLSHASSSLARSQCRHLLLLASRSCPSASPLGKPWLRNGTKPLHCLSAAHCFSSSTTTVRATLSPSINQSSWRGFDASRSLMNVLSWSQGDSLSSSSSGSVRSEAIPAGMRMVVLVTHLRYARISARLLYRYLLSWIFSCICSATANSHS